MQGDSTEAAAEVKYSEADQTSKGCVSHQPTTPDIVEDTTSGDRGDLQDENGIEHVFEGIGPSNSGTLQNW